MQLIVFSLAALEQCLTFSLLQNTTSIHRGSEKKQQQKNRLYMICYLPNVKMNKQNSLLSGK